MKMKMKPTTTKGILKELVESCEQCGNRNINIVEYKIYEKNKRKKGFFEDWLVPIDPEERRKLEERQRLENREGIEIIYYCNVCGEYFKQYYDSSTVLFWYESFKKRYE